jgi:uncharacterized protein YggE
MFIRLLVLLLLCVPAFAADYKPDDMISVALTTEGWVTTKTARVVLDVNASVSAATTGTTRAEMIKAVNALGGGEWRIINFSRSQSSAGLENWIAQFENRLPEADLGGINEKLKKASKPGMQITVNGIDFTPTLAETEAAQSDLRKTILEMANAELKNVHAAFPDRGYRIAGISFNGGAMPTPMMMRNVMAMKAAPMQADAMVESAQPLEAAQKLTLTAQVIFSAVAPIGKQEAGK